jgi:hypothetical protein
LAKANPNSSIASRFSGIKAATMVYWALAKSKMIEVKSD